MFSFCQTGIQLERLLGAAPDLPDFYSALEQMSQSSTKAIYEAVILYIVLTMLVNYFLFFSTTTIPTRCTEHARYPDTKGRHFPTSIWGNPMFSWRSAK
jgi:hypothetical protein